MLECSYRIPHLKKWSKKEPLHKEISSAPPAPLCHWMENSQLCFEDLQQAHPKLAPPQDAQDMLCHRCELHLELLKLARPETVLGTHGN